MSLVGVYDDANVFAQVIAGRLPCTRVFEDADVLAFMDLFPQSPGHALVVSKTSRARNILEIEPEALDRVMRGAQRLAKAVDKALKPDGIVVTQFNGAPAGQTVFHLHVHVIPRYEDVPMKGHGQAVRADPAGLAEQAAKIAAALDQPPSA